MVATLRSFLLFLFLVSACLFEMASTHPHFSLETVPLAGSPAVLQNHTIASFKRQETGDDSALIACGNDPAACDRYLGSTKPAPVIEVAPMNPPGNHTCEPSPTGHYQNARKTRMEAAAWWFCWTFAAQKTDQTFEEYRATLPITKTVWLKDTLFGAFEYGLWREGKKTDDNVYDFRIEWVEDCKPNDKTGLDPLKPLNDFECQGVLIDSWNRCNNKGRGGAMTAGCYRYRIRTRFWDGIGLRLFSLQESSALVLGSGFLSFIWCMMGMRGAFGKWSFNGTAVAGDLCLVKIQLLTWWLLVGNGATV